MSAASNTRRRSTKLQQGQDAITDSVKRQVNEAGRIAQDAVISGVWAYPIYGILYLISHPLLAKPLVPVMLKGIVMSIGVVGIMFFFTYLPQVAVLAFVTGPLAFLAAIPLVLGESYVVVNFLTKSFLMEQVGVDLFDAVLVQKGHTALVEKGRQVSSSGNKTAQLGRLLSKPLARFSLDNAVRYILSLPLTFIPVVGTVFFLAFNGYKAGPGYHARYFQLKGFDKEKRQAAITKRRGSYTAFGGVTLLLNLIPVASIFFSFTSIVGAALWAASIESGASPKAAVNSADEVSVSLPGEGKTGKKEL